MNDFYLPKDFDLWDSIGMLYKTNDYFVRLPIRGTASFESDYHELVVDPDGNRRDLTSFEERMHKLNNFQGEILEYLCSLPDEPRKIMDIGCGPGWLLSALSDHWDKNGIEISNFASQMASKYAHVINVSIEGFECQKNEYDVVVMHHVIEHLQDPVVAIKKIHEMLKPGGILIIGTPDFDCGAARRYGNNFRLLHDRTHVSLFSNDSMHRFLRDHGFHIEKVDYPFFKTSYFSYSNLQKMLETDIVSPPFYGSLMTFLAIKA